MHEQTAKRICAESQEKKKLIKEKSPFLLTKGLASYLNCHIINYREQGETGKAKRIKNTAVVEY